MPNTSQLGDEREAQVAKLVSAIHIERKKRIVTANLASVCTDV